MVHQYKNNGYNMVLDVNSGSVHVVDEMVYDMIAVALAIIILVGAILCYGVGIFPVDGRNHNKCGKDNLFQLLNLDFGFLEVD